MPTPEIVFNDPWVAEYVADRAAVKYEVGDPSIGILRDGMVLGGFLFTDWNGISIQCHMAGQRGWLTREMVLLFFGYAFNQLKAKKLIAPVASSNQEAMAMDLRAGFVEEARIKGAREDGDMVFLTMTRDQCRWLSYKLRPRVTSESKGPTDG